MSFQTRSIGRPIGVLEPKVGKVSEDASLAETPAFLAGTASTNFAKLVVESGVGGFLAHGAFDAAAVEILSSAGVAGCDSLPPSLVSSGDIVSMYSSGLVRVLHRATATHNSILLTERCNSWCVMCSQPPRPRDAAGSLEEAKKLVSLLPETTASIGLTGGEPLLLGAELIGFLRHLHSCLPSTHVALLTNGRLLAEGSLATQVTEIGHEQLTLCIPLYSDIDSSHDFVVGARGAFEQTIRGILRAGAEGLRIEIRVVVHRSTVPRLAALAEFVCRNLSFVSHVAIMGLEPIGFGRTNLSELWVDPHEVQSELRGAVAALARSRIPVSLYNFPLCTLDPGLRPYARKSISDWKNAFPQICSTCAAREDCCGLFQSALEGPWGRVLNPLPARSLVQTREGS